MLCNAAMLKLPNALRDHITGYMSTLVVPVPVGENLAKIIAALSTLEPLPDDVAKVPEKPKATK